MRHFLRFRKTRGIAKDRLKILLISDRVNCSPQTMDNIREDITKVLSKYMKIDEEQMEIQIGQMSARDSERGQTPVLYINIPIIDLRSKQDLCQRNTADNYIGG